MSIMFKGKAKKVIQYEIHDGIFLSTNRGAAVAKILAVAGDVVDSLAVVRVDLVVMVALVCYVLVVLCCMGLFTTELLAMPPS